MRDSKFNEIKIEDTIDFFLDELIIMEYSAVTIKIYRDILIKFKSFISDNYSDISFICDITLKHLSSFRIFLKKSLEMTQSLIDRVISCLKTFYKILSDMSIVSTNLMENLKHQRKTKKNCPISIDIEEVGEIIEEVEDNKDNPNIDMAKLIYTLISQTGSRRSTLLNLKWTHVDFDKETITLDSGNKQKN